LHAKVPLVAIAEMRSRTHIERFDGCVINPERHTSAVDLTFVPALLLVVRPNVNPKKRTSFIKLLLSLLVLAFAHEAIAK
jgi:hypothetical protein